MGIITRMRKQTAVYWKPLGSGEDGRPTFEAPIEVKCRWDDRMESYLDRSGNQRISNSVIYPDRVLLLDGYLWLGELVDAPVDPTTLFDARRIERFDQTPNLRNTETLYTAYC